MVKNTLLIKKTLIISIFALFITCSLSGQNYGKITNPSFQYVAEPGLINTIELTGAIGLSRDSISGIGIGDNKENNSKYYFGISDIIGYQINRNFATGIGAGYYMYDHSSLVPFYIDLRYTAYLKHFHPYLYANGGYMFALTHFFEDSEIFINPGIGFSKAFTYNLEGGLAVGLMVQNSSTMGRRSFLNLKLNITFRKNPFRMYKESSVKS